VDDNDKGKDKDKDKEENEVVIDYKLFPLLGAKAPDFTLTSDEEKPVKLSDFKGSNVVIYFFPKANTPGCTKQACALRDWRNEHKTKDTVIVAISPDKPPSMQGFKKKHNLNFVLLSDPENKVAKAYGAYASGLVRSHYAIDREGKLKKFKVKVSPLETRTLAEELSAS